MIDELQATRVAMVASYLVDSGRIVPSLEVDGARGARSWWLPLPATGDRQILAGLLVEDTLEQHAAIGQMLAVEVDRLARERLAAAGARLIEPRKGRRSVQQAWLGSLTATDPWLAPSLPADRVSAFAEKIAGWATSGAATLGPVRLCIRVHEPDKHPAARTEDGHSWWLALLVQDADEPSLLAPIEELWAGRSLFPPGSAEAVLRSLARTVALAPLLSPLLEEAAPAGLACELADLLAFLDQRLSSLAEIGVPVLLPSWWNRRQRVALRARARAPRAGPGGVVTASGLDFDALVSFTWEAALGGQRLTVADLGDLERAAAAKVELVQLRGEWVQVDAKDLDAVLTRAGKKSQASIGALVRANLGLADLEDPGTRGRGDSEPDPLLIEGSGRPTAAHDPPNPPTQVLAPGWLGDLLAGARDATLMPVLSPAGFVGTLRPYQERGVGWLTFLGRLGVGACLADDMGLGKTAQLIAALLADPTPGPALVVCPVSVLGNWMRELERFAPALKVLAHHGADRFGADTAFADRAASCDVVLTTYSLVARDIDVLSSVAWGRVALDEAQQIKNAATATSRAVGKLAASRRVALTGTPVENRLAELWSIMRFLNPALLGSLASFTRRFAAPIERDHDADASDLLRRLVGPFVLRRLKSDRAIINDLPDKIEQTEPCQLTREQATLYQAVVDDLLAAADSEEGIGRSGAILAGISRLKQVCNHPAHFLGDGSPLPGRSGKLERVEELLDAIVDGGDQVLCFTQFAEWGHRLVGHLARRYGTEPLWLHGGVPRRAREELMARFQHPGGPPIFLLSLKAGGTGLNLTAASHVIHLDRWWNPAVEDQATDRAYRIGQRRTVHVHKLVTTGTIEERVDQMIASKRQLAERVVGSGEQWITKLDTAALREVVALRDSDVV